MTGKSALYFIGIVPGEPVQSEVTDFKREMAERFGSKHALRSPAHITLVPPFRAGAEQLTRIQDALGEVAGSTTSFDIRLNGFDAFRPRVIFVNPEQSDDLAALQASVREAVEPFLPAREKRRERRPFHAHLTIAFRDLRRRKFYEAWKYFGEKEYRRTVPVEELVLLKNEEKRWKPLQRWKLQGSNYR